MKRFGEIYMITCLTTRKSYIGQTIHTIEQRFLEHVRLSRNARRQTAISCALRELGAENFEIQSLATCFSRVALDATEARLIAEQGTVYPNGYNLRDGGFSHSVHASTKAKISNSMKGIVHSAESIKKMADSNRGKTRSKEQCRLHSEKLKGRKQDPAIVEKRAAALRGKKRPPEVGQLISKALKGKPQRPEVVEKRAEARRGKKLSAEARLNIGQGHRKPIIDHNGVLYPSVKQASIDLGISACYISKVLNGQFKCAKGFSFYWA